MTNIPFNNKVVRKLYLKDKQTNTIKELLTLKDNYNNLIHKRVDLSYYNYIPEPGLPDPALSERHKETWTLDVEHIPSAPVPPEGYNVDFLGFTDNLDTKELVDFNTYIVPKIYQDFYAIWSRDILPKFNLFDKTKLTKELSLSLVEQYLISLFDTILLTKEFEATQIEQHVLNLVDKIKLNTNLSVSKVEQYIISLYDKIRLSTTLDILKVEQYVTNLKDTIKVLNELEVSKVEQYNINLLDKVRINLEANLDKVEQYLISLADVISLSTEENLTKVEQYNINLDDRIELLKSIDISKVEQYITNLTDNIDLNTLTNLIKVEEYIISLDDKTKLSKEVLTTKIEQLALSLVDSTKINKNIGVIILEIRSATLTDNIKMQKAIDAEAPIILPTLPTPNIAASATCTTSGTVSNPWYTFSIEVTNTASVQVRMYVSIGGVWQNRLMPGGSTQTFTRSKSTSWGFETVEAYSTADGYENSETRTVIRSVSCPAPDPDPPAQLVWKYNGTSSQPFCFDPGYNMEGTTCFTEGATQVVTAGSVGRSGGCVELICSKK